MDCDIMNRLMIGVEMLESQLDEERVAEYFSSVDGLEMNDDYIFSGDSKIEYFVVEKANYAVFKDINNNEFFTNHVIGFLRNVNSKDKVFDAKPEFFKSDVKEASDVIYHLLVYLEANNIKYEDVLDELNNRTSQSGLEEKASRN